MQYRCDRRKQSNLTYDKILGQRVGFWVALKIYYLTFVFFVVVGFYGAVLKKKKKTETILTIHEIFKCTVAIF